MAVKVFGLETFSSFDGFTSWFFNAPFVVQISLIIFVVAVVILSLILTYYILKGVAYLIYYIFKGIYMLLSGLYYALTGKERPVKVVKKEMKKKEIITTKVPIEVAPQRRLIQEYKPEVRFFCSECGMKFTDRMMFQINAKGIVFCEQCGKGFQAAEFMYQQQAMI